ncbi:hypothetical protein L1987_16189 [Smallanthus sonchifolius]|uniref:Uncharacterized protein n=1 Tax=Smallanthus sonchifolius TaxID=185202 RepID=A0ACB9J9S4_9ASTR|nr:hypothetical protein L1987_16189 [Smallanthus sonchifolius]
MDVYRAAQMQYKEWKNIVFNHDATWRILKDHPNWRGVPLMDDSSQRNKRAYTPETLSSKAPIAPEVVAEPERPTRKQKKTPSSSQSSKEEQFQKLLVEFNEISEVTKAEHEDKKRYQANLEEMKAEMNKVKKREMEIQRKEKDFQFYIQYHDHLTGPTLTAMIQMKS